MIRVLVPGTDNWEKLKKEMRDQFLPNNASWIAKDCLKKIRKNEIVKAYIKELTSLILDIQNILDKDKLHNFSTKMQAWAQNELRRQNVKDFPNVISVIDSLLDVCSTRPKIPASSKSKKKVEKKGE